MRRAATAAPLLGLLIAASASAAWMDASIQTWTVPSGGTATVYVYAEPETGDEAGMGGVDFYLKVADGAVHGDTGPQIVSVDLIGAGTIAADGWTDPWQSTLFDDPPDYTPQDVYTTAYDNAAVPQAIDPIEGLLARVVVDATGVAPDDYTLGFRGTSGDSLFYDVTGEVNITTNYRPGTIRVTSGAIPEPAAIVQLVGLMAAAGTWIWSRNRRR